MKRLSYSRYFGAAVVFGICLVSLTGNSFADSRHFEHGHGWDSHYEHFRQPYFYRHLPPGFLALQIADELFYYAEGIYYQETPSGYVIVSAPRGAVITRLPERHKVIVYDNTDYYYYNDAYYVKEPQGYTVVTPPPQVVSSNPPAAEAPEKTVVVQVPNPNGSFIPVTLQ